MGRSARVHPRAARSAAGRASVVGVVYLLALIVAVAALVVVVTMLVRLAGPVRRFRAALRDYRARVQAKQAALHDGRQDMHAQLRHLRTGQRQHNDATAPGTIG